MGGRKFVLVVVDCDTAEFTVEGPMTDDRGWYDAVMAAHVLGRHVRCFRMGDLTPDAAAAEWRAASGGRRLAAGSILLPRHQRA